MNKQIFATTILALLVMMIVSSPAMGATYDSTIELVEKNSTWQPVSGGETATVDFNASGDEFAWHAYGTVPNFAGEVAECYALIYYADEDDRFVNWDGSNPGACIGMFQVDACSGDFDSGDQTTDLGINLPEYPDWNINPDPWDTYCNEEGDNYTNCCGAKLWIVPCSDYDEPAMTAWNPEDYLFETELIWYDDTDYNIEPSITETTVNVSCVEAGNTVLIGATVSDGDGEYDLENMVVTANMSTYGVDEIVILEYIGMIDCVFANYSAEVTVTTSTIDDCNDRYRPTSFNIYAEDPSGANDTLEAYLDVEPGPCTYMELENYNAEEEELRTVALTHLWDCNTCPVMWWCDDEMFDVYMLVYSVHLYDEYGNYIGEVGREDCCEDYTATLDSGSSASMKSEWNWWWYGDNKIVIVNELLPGESTLTVHCVGECLPDLVQEIEFLYPVSSLNVTTDVDVIYESDECSDGNNSINISAQIIDCYSDPIPMPRVDVTLYINLDGYCIEYDTVQTDDNGVALFVDVDMSEYETGDVISIRAEAECREGTLEIDVVDPVLGFVEIVEPESPMDCGDDQQLEIICFDVNGNPMCCPECCICPPYNINWTSTDLGEFSDEPGETGLFTALNSGIATVTVTLDNITDDAEIVINCPMNCTDEPDMCQTYPYDFSVTSGSVNLSGTFVDEGYACVEAIGDPIGNWTNDTRGARVDMNESAVENVTLDLDGEGDIWVQNETTGNWSMLGDGEIVNGTYALVTPGTPSDSCDGVVCDDTTCVDGNVYNMTCVDGECVAYMLIEVCNGTVCNGTDLYNMTCVDGVCVEYMMVEENCTECGYVNPNPDPTPTRRRSSGGSGGGLYPPNWPNGDSGNATVPDDKVSIPTPTATEPKSPTRPDTSGDKAGVSGDEAEPTPTDTPSTPGFIAAVAIVGIIAVAFLLGRKKD